MIPYRVPSGFVHQSGLIDGDGHPFGVGEINGDSICVDHLGNGLGQRADNSLADKAIGIVSPKMTNGQQDQIDQPQNRQQHANHRRRQNEGEHKDGHHDPRPALGEGNIEADGAKGQLVVDHGKDEEANVDEYIKDQAPDGRFADDILHGFK